MKALHLAPSLRRPAALLQQGDARLLHWDAAARLVSVALLLLLFKGFCCCCSLVLLALFLS